MIARGARDDGWRHQRFLPLIPLVTRRAPAAAFSREAYRQKLFKTEMRGLTYCDELIACAADDETRELVQKMKSDVASPQAAREAYDEFSLNYERLISNGADKSNKDKAAIALMTSRRSR